MNSYVVLPALVAGLCLVLIVVALKQGYQTVAQRVFCLFFFSMGWWSVVIFAMRTSPDLAHAYFWERWVFPAIVFTAVFYYHFTLLYTGVKYPRWLLMAAYTSAFTILILAPTDVWVAGMQIKPYGFAPVFGKGFPLILFTAYFCVIGGIFNLARSYRLSRSYEDRNRYMYLMIGAGCQLVGAAFDILPTLGLPLYPGGIIANGIFCLVTGIAIVKYHLLDINIIIRRGTTYLIMSAIVALPYVGVISLFYILFGSSMSFWASLVILVALAFGLQPVWRGVQGTVDRMFFRERYDFLRDLESFSQETHDITDIKQIATPLVSLLGHALQASSVHLLLATSSNDFEVVSSIGRGAAQFKLESHSPLITWLKSHKTILHREDMDFVTQLQCLTEKEMVQLKSIRAEMYFPLKTKADELLGILVLSDRLVDEPYSEQDERLVLTVAGRIAVELENAVLYASEKAMREELQKQNQQKTEFLHQVAHELKTPLTAIISSSELLDEELPSKENSPLRRLINNISHSAWSMDKRITDLLDFARMQVGTLTIKAQPIEVAAALEQIASVLEVLFKNKDQSFKVEAPENLPPMKADRDRFEQVLINLLSNANKFSPSGTGIILRAKQDGSRIIVEVEDSAQPITDVEKTKLFEPYYRGEDADKRQRLPGLGLGLAISKRLVEMQSGEMWITTAPGKGNTFCFSVPAAEPGKKPSRPTDT